MAIAGTNAAGRDIVIHHQTVQATSAPTVVPSELPMAVVDFVDRQEATVQLCGLLEDGLDTGTTTIAAISGAPGVGKTALALSIAHRLRDRFGSGNLFMDLVGARQTSLDSSAVLGEFLLALGAARIPESVDDQARLYRSLLGSGRYLVVLDNARDERQLRPLLPPATGCAVLITSRRRLTLPESVRTITLEALDERFGMDLLAAVTGIERVQAQEADALRIVRSCGGYPLALRIAAARLAGRPHWRLSRLAERLDDQRRRLGELHMGDEEVRAGFALSHDALDPQARKLFRLLGLVDLLDFAAWLPSTLLGTDPDDAEELAEQLCEAHLLQAGEADATGSVRYHFHDLLRAFAGERLDAEADEAERSQALTRLLDAYLLLTIRADAGFSAANSAIWGPWEASLPALPANYLQDADDHLEWFAKERANLLRVIAEAHRAQRWETTWRLAVAMWQFLEITARFADWRTAFDLALDAARQAGDKVAEGSCLRLLGRLELTRGNVDAAADLFEKAITLLSSADDAHGTCMARKDISVVARLRNRHGASIDLLLTALNGFIGLAEHYWVAIVRRELGIEYRYEGQWTEADEHFRQAIAVFVSIGEQLQTAQTRFELAVLERLRGNWAAAQECLDQAAPVFDRLDARGQQAWTLRESALVAAGKGELDTAVSRLSRCLELWQELDDSRQHAATLHELALAHQRRAEPEEALAASQAAVDEFRQFGDQLSEARALVTLAVLSADTGAPDAALAAIEKALPVFRANADLLWEVKAQHARAAACRALGDPDAARDADVLAEGLGRYVRGSDEARI